VLKITGEREARWAAEMLAWTGLVEYHPGADTPAAAE
jgi:hypothetical protein